MADFKQFGRRLLLGAALYAPLTMAAEKELVILTTFSQAPITALVDDFTQHYPDAEVRVVHRRTQ
ncbi:ABC transporter substrate-binding protein, partial [Vibrio sp. Vb0932]|nr:ABC transporter substrate-binding protein [Vibrio sp. Vb0932]